MGYLVPMKGLEEFMWPKAKKAGISWALTREEVGASREHVSSRWGGQCEGVAVRGTPSSSPFGTRATGLHWQILQPQSTVQHCFLFLLFYLVEKKPLPCAFLLSQPPECSLLQDWCIGTYKEQKNKETWGFVPLCRGCSWGEGGEGACPEEVGEALCRVSSGRLTSM